ncbi:hypothetical protein GCM10023350_36730 [Nocardioides endophyticus]|uniref:Uncharacterized protein n=1 Tax=Nocardioides endophyticus TaxID=1353775 RepID=A0ABP8Z7A1_9ACTN
MSEATIDQAMAQTHVDARKGGGPIRWLNNRTHRRLLLDDLSDLDAVGQILTSRAGVLSDAQESLRAMGYDEEQSRKLAAVDLFVEKAQRVLSRRAQRMFTRGTTYAVAAALMLVGAIGFTGWRMEHSSSEVDPSTQQVVLMLFQSLALAAIIYVSVKWFVALASSFFHEAVSLWERRHALRFGRLYMYLNPDEVKLADVETAFQWNKQSATSFMEISPAAITDTVFNKLVDAMATAPPETAKAIAEAIASHEANAGTQKKSKKK